MLYVRSSRGDPASRDEEGEQLFAVLFVQAGQAAGSDRLAAAPHQLVTEQARLQCHVTGRPQTEAGAQLARKETHDQMRWRSRHGGRHAQAVTRSGPNA